jgi:hypothetical protein
MSDLHRQLTDIGGWYLCKYETQNVASCANTLIDDRPALVIVLDVASVFDTIYLTIIYGFPSFSAWYDSWESEGLET